MKQIIRITVGLTLSCLVAAVVMGSVFIITDKAKKHNQHLNEQETMLSLLGYGKGNVVPSSLELHTIYRYILEEEENKYLGYMIPVKKGKDESYELVVIDLEGRFKTKYEVPIPPEKAMEAPNREAALKGVIKPPAPFTYADTVIIATLDGRRMAYLLPGEFPGFKTFIKVMLALDPTFKILGMEIMEHEEDPGLGAEIAKDYFKNQFGNKNFSKVKELGVVKEPLPEVYRKLLETKKWGQGGLSKEEVDRIREIYKDKDIYALTGATISSRAVTEGVKGMMKKFAYRVQILDDVIAKQKVPVAF